MKKIALGIALVMLLTMAFGVFASADFAAPVVTPDVFGASMKDGSIQYLGTETDDIPDDIFGVVINATVADGFCYYRIPMSFDPTLIEYVTCCPPSEDGELLGIYEGTYNKINGGTFSPNETKAAQGYVNFNMVNATNFTKKSGLKTVTQTDATCVIVYFRPLTEKACNATISFATPEFPELYFQNSDDEHFYNYADVSAITLKLNGGAPVATEALESLGAQVNEEKKGIRFGANFYNLEGKAAVEDLGMLLISDYRLGDGTLDLDLANEYVVKVQARGILNYVEGNKLEDYANVTFVAAVLGLDGHLDDDIVARPYVVYADEEVAYDDAMTRNYNYVLEHADNKF